MSDYLDEELEIMDERSKDNIESLSNQTFHQPIKLLCKYLKKLRKLDTSATIGEAVKLMQSEKIGAVLIVDNDDLKGIVTERDILMKVVGKIDNWDKVSISEIMTPNPSWLMSTDKIGYLMNKMHVGGYRHVPIVDNNKAVYLISIRDVMSFILDYFPEDILNLPPEPQRTGSEQREGA